MKLIALMIFTTLPLQAYSDVDCNASTDGLQVHCVASSMDEINTIYGNFSDCSTFKADNNLVVLSCDLTTPPSIKNDLISPQDSMRKPEYR